MSTPLHRSPATASQLDPARPQPWWRFGMVWLVLSGPALVVVAAFVTMAIAFQGADVVVEAPAPGAAPLAAATAPALQARNHAATPPPTAAVR